ncbi:MAG: prolyl oligopeptidase family serine peptidase, partial [Firmicutes bacterium]|nr:prolyl oligopeptidase family serine peptidase [Bacillota bacterium]
FTSQDFPLNSFMIENRNIVKCYTNNEPNISAEATNGQYIIIELDSNDEAAFTVTDINGRCRFSKIIPDPKSVITSAPKRGGIFGIQTQRKPIKIGVRQIYDIKAADNSILPAWTHIRFNNQELNQLSDLFLEQQFKDISYNLFIPENYNAAQSYPLLLFIHDAGTIGLESKITLEQGIGATIWADKQEQTKHPCFILAPQHSKETPITRIIDGQYTASDDINTIKEICDELQKQYNIDSNRIYLTGQSMGFMASIALMLRFPHYFAAALLLAGHWDVQNTATLWDKNIWIFLSAEDQGTKRMHELPQMIRHMGGQLGEYEVNADQSKEAICKSIQEAANDENSFRITRFLPDSIWRKNQPDRTNGGGHDGTWHLVYQLEAARDWLFTQKL